MEFPIMSCITMHWVSYAIQLLFIQAGRNSRRCINMDEARGVPFRKMKLASKIYSKRTDVALSKRIREKFERFQKCIIVLGNWSAGMSPYHEPIRGKGARRCLRRMDSTLLVLMNIKPLLCAPTANPV